MRTFNYSALKTRPRPYQIFNIGFRSLSDAEGKYLLIGVDDRKK